MKKRYCIFAAHYLPHLGGIERYVYNMSQKLIQNGDSVVIVTSKIGDMPAYEVMEGVPVYRMSCLEFLDGRFPVLKYDRNTRKIFRMLRQKRFDMIIVNARFYVLSLAAVIFAKSRNTRCMVLEHGSSHVTMHNKVFDFCGRVFEHAHTFLLKCFRPEFFGTCEACNQWLEHFHIKSRGIVYNAINMDEVKKSLETKGNYRERYGISSQDRVIVFTGRLLEEKGLLSLMDAVDRLNREGRGIYLFIAGTGDLEPEVQKRKSRYVIPLGYIEHEEVFRLLEEGDIYCLPSVSEAFCGGVLEAVACRCYVITTAQGGSKELISSKDLGKIMETNDADTVYRALNESLDNWEMCREAADNAYRKLVQNYTWDIIVKKLREL